MMLRKNILSFASFICFLAAAFLFVSPAAAFSGVQGRAFDSYAQPWEHGGQVYVFNNTTGQLVASGDLVTGDPANNGRFDFPYTQTTHGGNGTTPSQGHLMSIFIVYNDGGVGTPALAQRDYTELAFITSRYNAGNFDTLTGPTAVTLSSFGSVSSVNTSYVLPALFIILGGLSVFALRRQKAHQNQ
jgi:hypothetical protein